MLRKKYFLYFVLPLWISGWLVAPMASLHPHIGLENKAASSATISPSIVSQNTSIVESQPTGQMNQNQVLPTTTTETLRLLFPTQAQEAVSAWHPPLYPTPWIPMPYDHFFFARPTAADEINWPLANYRYGGVFFKDVVHTGVDIPVKTGTPIIAAGSGRINWAGYGLFKGAGDTTDPYGLAVVIRHDFGYQGQTLFTVYGHLSRVDVTVGQCVETGDSLGLSGATGNVTGPHLHFEVRIGKNNFSRSRNPELWMSPPQGWGVLAGKILDIDGRFIERQQIIIRSSDTDRKWSVISYGRGAANSDAYYKENVVIGDLPAGNYTIWIPYQTSHHLNIQILPGRVNYFTFQQGLGFGSALPPTPRSVFIPPLPPEETPTP